VPHYRSVGDVPRKRHTFHHDAHGNRYAEELIGQEGFSSASSLLSHRHSPSAIVAIDAIDTPPAFSAEATPDLPLTPRHLRTPSLPTDHGDLVLGRHLLLANHDVSISWVESTEASPLYRDAVGDQLAYVQHGRATLESVFGRLTVEPGHYVVVPAATTHRWVPEGAEAVGLLVVSTRGHVTPPRKYLSPTGQFLEHAPYCERDLRAPDEPLLVDGHDVPVVVRNRAGRSRHVHRHHPFDVVGWDGALYPWAFHIDDFEPIVGRLHQPPPVHQTFEGPGFVVCSFVPRPFDFHPDAVKVPYHHSNTDSDEVVFYSRGDFMSRSGSGIGVASISYHPAGFVHGPQPGSVEASMGAERTEEVAVMIDTFAPLGVTDAAREISDPDYPFTWAR
jgi:homogentisate 1,2-dioxygenase